METWRQNQSKSCHWKLMERTFHPVVIETVLQILQTRAEFSEFPASKDIDLAIVHKS